MKAIFITSDDLKRYSIIDGNVDPSKYKQYMEIAQDIHVQNYLGTDLYEKLQAIIIAATVDAPENASYKTLLETYIKPMHVHWTMVEYIPFAAYQVANGGVFKHNSENSETVEKNEVDYILDKERNTAQYYTSRMISYINNNLTSFPEYYTNSNGDISPDQTARYTGWVL